jgi:hypothetical protein
MPRASATPRATATPAPPVPAATVDDHGGHGSDDSSGHGSDD